MNYEIKNLDKVLATLSAREQEVLKLRFGLDDGQSRTLKEIGQKLDVTPERIRQIEARALRKLRYPSRSSLLNGQLQDKPFSEWTPADTLLRAIFGGWGQ